MAVRERHRNEETARCDAWLWRWGSCSLRLRSRARRARRSPLAASSAGRPSGAPAAAARRRRPPLLRLPAPTGVAVVALGGATDAAWPLARAVYGTPSLRPAAVDETRARVLCGEPAPASSPQDLRDLADSLAAVKGDDAPSRMLLGEIAHRLNVRAIVVVRVDGGQPTARVFLPETGSLRRGRLRPRRGADGRLDRDGALAHPRLRERAAPASPPHVRRPALATHEEPVVTGRRRGRRPSMNPAGSGARSGRPRSPAEPSSSRPGTTATRQSIFRCRSRTE